MMRKEAREWCQYEDGKYIEHLKQQIVYFNERLVIRSMEGAEIANPVRELLDILSKELDMREEEYRREYGNKSGKCIFTESQEDTDGKNGSADASVNIVTNVEPSDTRDTSG
jgi:hypothetical protein